MSRVPEEIHKRQIVLDDGRYLIFYTVALAKSLRPDEVPVPSPQAPTNQPEEEN